MYTHTKQFSIMENLSLKNCKLHEDMSEETPCFSADLYDNGKLVAHVKNSGHGGSNDVRPAKGINHKDVIKYMDLDTDCHIMGMVEEYNFVTKYEAKALVLRKIDNHDSIATASLLSPLSKMKKSPTYDVWLERQRKKLKEQGYEIINRNL